MVVKGTLDSPAVTSMLMISWGLRLQHLVVVSGNFSCQVAHAAVREPHCVTIQCFTKLPSFREVFVHQLQENLPNVCADIKGKWWVEIDFHRPSLTIGAGSNVLSGWIVVHLVVVS